MTKAICNLHITMIALSVIFCINHQAYCATENNNSKIAVMNFDNRSSSKEWQWLSKGLADMLITDLSASERLSIVERERLSEIVAELKLVKTGVVDSSIADQVGRIAKVDWVLFGSFIKQGNHLKIEGHILNLSTEKIMRVEWVEGPSDDVLKLEKQLEKNIATLGVPEKGFVIFANNVVHIVGEKWWTAKEFDAEFIQLKTKFPSGGWFYRKFCHSNHYGLVLIVSGKPYVVEFKDQK
jgi:TolB-like protein